ncbi:hypothetical protein M758_11G027900 [Ceratodon purpureus]|nr:hypothetical protein M758_11G027900 [Ceratodon purpureus]
MLMLCSLLSALYKCAPCQIYYANLRCCFFQEISRFIPYLFFLKIPIEGVQIFVIFNFQRLIRATEYLKIFNCCLSFRG